MVFTRSMSREWKQRFFSEKSMLFLLAFMSAFPVLSTDLYLPAIPKIADAIGATTAQINLTLSLFVISFSLGILFWGPLSEKYGRKPILFIGLTLYTASSICCGLAGNCFQLIVFRILQAFGGGAATALSIAMVKDVYGPEKRERALTIVTAMVAVSPIVAPVIGAQLLKTTSWRTVFGLLSGAGFFAISASFLLEEPLIKKFQGSSLKSMGRLFQVLKNPGLSFLLGTASMMAIPQMAFIAGSSHIYIEMFGIGEQQFSFYFSLNALCSVAGPVLYLKICKKFDQYIIISGCFMILMFSGLLILFVGKSSPLLFTFTMLPATISITGIRPPSDYLMLEQQESDTGSVSSVIKFFYMLLGSVGMFLVSLNENDMIRSIGLIQAGTGLFGFLLWAAFQKKIMK